MNWQRIINDIDEMCRKSLSPPPSQLRERAKRYAHKLMESGVSPPGNVEMSPSGDIEFRWTFPEHDMLCSLWAEGCGVWLLVFRRGQAEITSWPVEE